MSIQLFQGMPFLAPVYKQVGGSEDLALISESHSGEVLG